MVVHKFKKRKYFFGNRRQAQNRVGWQYYYRMYDFDCEVLNGQSEARHRKIDNFIRICVDCAFATPLDGQMVHKDKRYVELLRLTYNAVFHDYLPLAERLADCANAPFSTL